MKCLWAVLIAITLVFSFASCKGGTSLPETQFESASKTVLFSESETETSPVSSRAETYVPSSLQSGEVSQVTQTAQQPQTKKETSPVTAAPVDTNQNTDYTRTGIIAFSDSPDNKYIKLVSEKYGVSPLRLAAIYTLPYEGMEEEADGNMVLEFDGSKNSKGKLIRTKDTLKTIYFIDSDNVLTKVSADGSGEDDYSFVERTKIVWSVKSLIIPKFQDELNKS
ncbi:MAG: hypothetical protein ACOX45_08760 [Acutalibacteraceae bacterium]